MLSSIKSNAKGPVFLDSEEIRQDFPIFEHNVIEGKPLVYLDSSASSLKPRQVIQGLVNYYERDYANIHRGIYPLSIRSTELFEKSRENFGRFIGLEKDFEQIIFTKGATEALNLLAHSLGLKLITKGDKIVISDMEHHANLIPWQQLAKRKGAELVFMPFSRLKSMSEVDESFLSKYIDKKTKIVSFTGMSNALGSLPPIKIIHKFAKKMGAVTVLDAAQYACHQNIDVEDLAVDFIAFAGHKMLGPTGIGALYGKKEILQELEPYQTGGDMIWRVTKEESSWNEVPARFEAGTPPIAQAVGLSHAIAYLENVGMEKIFQHERSLLEYALEKLRAIPDIVIYGDDNLEYRGGVISFNVKGVHPHDLGTILANDNIALRVGHHCCQVLMTELNVAATCRISFYLYNSREDVDRCIQSIEKAKDILS